MLTDKPRLSVMKQPQTMFEEEIMRALPQLHKVANSLMHDKTRGDDLFQQTVTHALEQQQFYHGGSALAWMITMMKNLKIDNAKSHVNSRSVPLASFDRAVAPTQETLVMLKEAVRMIERLPKRERDVLTKVVIEEESYAEAAKDLGVPVMTVGSRLLRGRTRLNALTR